MIPEANGRRHTLRERLFRRQPAEDSAIAEKRHLDLKEEHRQVDNQRRALVGKHGTIPGDPAVFDLKRELGLRATRLDEKIARGVSIRTEFVLLDRFTIPPHRKVPLQTGSEAHMFQDNILAELREIARTEAERLQATDAANPDPEGVPRDVYLWIQLNEAIGRGREDFAIEMPGRLELTEAERRG